MKMQLISNRMVQEMSIGLQELQRSGKVNLAVLQKKTGE